MKDGEEAVIKNLKKDTWYPLGDYNEPTEANGWAWQKDAKEDEYLNQLYRSSTDADFSEQFKLSVCCVVGKNGAGKSTLFDLMFRIINNLAYFLLEKKLEKEEDGENPQKGRSLSEAHGFAANLYFETDGNLGIISYSYGNMQYDYYDAKHTSKISEKFDREISNKRMHTVLNEFFYTICTNYSIHSFNEDDYDTKDILKPKGDKQINGDWIRGLLHKNDGYLTPVVIVPYRRKGGIINVANEEDLAIQRLSVLAVLLWSQGNKHLLDEYRPVSIEYRFDRDAAARYTKQYKDVLDEFLPLNGIEAMNLNDISPLLREAWEMFLANKNYYTKQEVDVQKAVLNYLCYKSLKICVTYRPYGKMIGIRAVTDDEAKKFEVEEGTLVAEATKDNVERLVNELADDKTHHHITLKLHQCLAFMKRDYYKTNADLHFDLPDSGEMIDYHKEGIKKFIEDNLKIDNDGIGTGKGRYNTYDEVFLRMPPSIFKWEVKLSHKGNRKESLSLRGMSSGEKQMLQSASYLLYHIKNIENIMMDKYRNPYHHINIVMDEAELYYHPEYQRQLIANMVDMMAACHINGNLIRSVNLMIATHSPFVLSDIPMSRTLYLKEGAPEKRVQQTFAANYHELLYNQFFIDNTMGEVGLKAFQEIVNHYKDMNSEIRDWQSSFSAKREYYHFIVGMIADNYLRKSLSAMLDEIDDKIRRES